jgi:hypothetical protein
MTNDNFCPYFQNRLTKPVKKEVNGTGILPPLVFLPRQTTDGKRGSVVVIADICRSCSSGCQCRRRRSADDVIKLFFHRRLHFFTETAVRNRSCKLAIRCHREPGISAVYQEALMLNS